MRLRSGLLIGELGGNQTNQVIAALIGTAMPSQDDNFSTRAEAGTPHPSFSTNGGERSPRSPGFGEDGPSNYRDSPQTYQHQYPPPSQGDGYHQVDIEHQDFQLYSTPTTDPNLSNDDEMRDDQIPIPELPQYSATNQHRVVPARSGQRSFDSYFEAQGSASAPTLSQVPRTVPPLPPLHSIPGQAPQGMLPAWREGPGAWSTVSPTEPENRKRHLVQENPDHDLIGYPKDRSFPDKMEEALESLGDGEQGSDSGEESRRKRRRKRATKLRPLKAKYWKDEPGDEKKDRENGQGGGTSSRVD